jgi:hypothetical protein
VKPKEPSAAARALRTFLAAAVMSIPIPSPGMEAIL